MNYYYSASTNGFYVDAVHADADVPDDLKAISEEDYAAIVGEGAGWLPGPDGLPVANPVPEMPEPPADDLPHYPGTDEPVTMVKFRSKFIVQEQSVMDAGAASPGQEQDNGAPRPVDDMAAERTEPRPYTTT